MRDAEPVEHGRDRQQERVGVAARRSASRCAARSTSAERPAPSSTSCGVDAAASRRAARARWRAALMTQRARAAARARGCAASAGSRMRAHGRRWAARRIGAPRRCGRSRSVNGVLQSLRRSASPRASESGADGLLDALLIVRAQVGHVDGGLGVQIVQRDRAEVLLDALEDGDPAVGLADVVARLRPLVAERERGDDRRRRAARSRSPTTQRRRRRRRASSSMSSSK